MEKNEYNIVSTFICNKKKMLIVRMSKTACVMTEEEYNKIIIAERKYRKLKNRKAV